jgi:hypothetical protein
MGAQCRHLSEPRAADDSKARRLRREKGQHPIALVITAVVKKQNVDVKPCERLDR